MKQWMIIAGGVMAGVAALLMMNYTSPDLVGPVGILVLFACLYVVLLSAIFLLLTIIVRLVLRVVKPGKWQLYFEEVSRQKLYYYASVLALMPLILIGMQSVGGVKLLDVSLVVLFEVIALFYINKRS